MNALRLVAWSLGGFVLAVLAFLIATVRVVEPKAAPVGAPVAALARGAQPVAPPPTPGPVTSAAMVATPLPALIVPVAGIDPAQLRSNWGEARGDGTRAHQGIDIMAQGGTPVVAAADGVIEKLFLSPGGGGITLYQRSADGGWTFYYAHLGGYAPGIAEGRKVRAGETIGYVGDTGNAGAGNHHLHFGVSAMAAGERWHQGTSVDPYPLLAGSHAGG